MIIGLYTIAFSVVGVIIFVLFQGYGFTDIFVSLWNIFGRTSEVVFALPLLTRLSHINNFFNATSLALYSFIIVYYIIQFRKTTFFERVLFAFALVNAIWWIFTYFDIHVRNLIYAVVVSHILFAVAFIHILKLLKGRAKVILFSSLLLFCVFRFVDATIFGLRCVNRGINDEIDYAIVGYETYAKHEFRSAQSEFYSFLDEEIAEGEAIYHIGVGFDEYVHTRREFRLVKRDTKIFHLPVNSYFVLTYLDYKNDFVWDELIVYLNNNADLVFKKNYYEVYRIIGQMQNDASERRFD